MAEFLILLAASGVKIIVVLIGIDVILGVIGALLKKEFVLGKLAGFMRKGILPYVLGFVVLVLAGQAVPALGTIVTIAYWLIVLALIGSILDNLGKMGVPIPKILRK